MMTNINVQYYQKFIIYNKIIETNPLFLQVDNDNKNIINICKINDYLKNNNYDLLPYDIFDSNGWCVYDQYKPNDSELNHLEYELNSHMFVAEFIIKVNSIERDIKKSDFSLLSHDEFNNYIKNKFDIDFVFESKITLKFSACRKIIINDKPKYIKSDYPDMQNIIAYVLKTFSNGTKIIQLEQPCYFYADYVSIFSRFIVLEYNISSI